MPLLNPAVPSLSPYPFHRTFKPFFFNLLQKKTKKQKEKKLAAVSFAEAVTVFIVYNEAAPWGLDEEQIDR